MASYVHKIDDYFKALGAEQPVRYFQSNGGLAVGSIMRERAVNAINSGPASAPQAGLYIASPFGIDDIITVDMGGTSFDITMAKAGRTSLNRDIDFLRNRIGVPMIHVETLGAGGGSLDMLIPLVCYRSVLRVLERLLDRHVMVKAVTCQPSQTQN